MHDVSPNKIYIYTAGPPASPVMLKTFIEKLRRHPVTHGGEWDESFRSKHGTGIPSFVEADTVLVLTYPYSSSGRKHFVLEGEREDECEALVLRTIFDGPMHIVDYLIPIVIGLHAVEANKVFFNWRC